MFYFTQPFYEIAIVGKYVDEKKKGFNKHFLPNTIFAGSSGRSSFSLLKSKFLKDKTFIYVCENKACKQPIEELDGALKEMNYSSAIL